MKKTEVQPLFKMAYSSLMQLGDKAVELIDRDTTELADYGVDSTVHDFIEDKTQDLKDFPTDEEYEGAVMVATEAKDAKADEVKVAVRSIMVRAKNGFGTESAKYRRFGTKGMDEMSDKDLVTCGKRVVRIGTVYLTELASKGLTSGILAALNTLVLAFDSDIDAQDDAIRVRDIATEDRLELGNALYAKIVEVFGFGKDYWVTRNESKYNDYVIYDTPAGSGITIVKEADVPPMTIVNIPVTDVHGTPLSELLSEISGSPLRIFAAATPIDGPGADYYDGQIGQAPFNLDDFKVAIGYSPTKQLLNVQSLGAIPAHIKLTFSKLAP